MGEKKQLDKNIVIALNIRRLRQLKGWSQEKLGEKCGLAGSAIRRYELGKSNPTMKTIERIANGLGVSPEILTNIPSPPANTSHISVVELFAGLTTKDTEKFAEQINEASKRWVEEAQKLIEGSQQEASIVSPEVEALRKEISDLRYSLNKEGLTKTRDYMYDLMEHPKYKAGYTGEPPQVPADPNEPQ